MEFRHLEQALYNSPTDYNRLLRLHTPLGVDILVAEYLDGWEAVDNGGFCLNISALSIDASLPLEELLGAPVMVELLCAESRSEPRPFHGHVSRCERVASNGGLGRYRLRIEPWLALLQHRQDSYAFHDMSVVQICESIFSHYHHGVVRAERRWNLLDSKVYPRRSLTTQFQESDWAFLHRLLAEEGIAYHFEHTCESRAQGVGRHIMVLTDTNFNLAPGKPTMVRFQRSDATEPEDSIQHWMRDWRWVNTAVTRHTWNYRSRAATPVSSSAKGGIEGVEDVDTSAPYAWIDDAHARRLASQHIEARQVMGDQAHGHGSWRRLAAGTRFSVSGYRPVAEKDEWLCLRVTHQAHNNFDVQLQAAVEARLGSIFDDDERPAGFGDRPISDRDTLYRNEFTAIPAANTYRPHTAEGYGLRHNPVATVNGPQRAIVVGVGEPMHSDRDHRVKIQYHWQRGSESSSGHTHPRGNDNARASGYDGTWVRVSTSMAGDNWGSVFLPRVGQEVWVHHIEGNIDRPVVVAALHNGQGYPDDPHSQMAGGPSKSSANTSAWFPGNGHADVFSGIKTQDLATSQKGTGGYRQLQFDDTPGQSRAQLYTTDQHTGLSLGHLKHSVDNKRLNDRGYGSELNTQAQGAVRAGEGLLLSTASGVDQMDAKAVVEDLEQAQSQLDQLAAIAQRHNAGLTDEIGDLPTSEALQFSQQALNAEASGHHAGQGIGGGEGQASAWSSPMLAVHGSAGLNNLTPESQVWVAGHNSLFSAGDDINLTADGKTAFIAGTGLSLYTQGNPADGHNVEETGIALHAASGSVSVRAQTDQISIGAKHGVSIASTEGSVHIEGGTHLLLAVKGGYVKLEGDNIEIGSPMFAEFKAGLHVMTGPKVEDPKSFRVARSAASDCQAKAGTSNNNGGLNK
ncbi:MAG: type VI secretion system Vgr family protein [Pseudomonas sp.]